MKIAFDIAHRYPVTGGETFDNPDEILSVRVTGGEVSHYEAPFSSSQSTKSIVMVI
jgi:hypothetical protein